MRNTLSRLALVFLLSTGAYGDVFTQRATGARIEGRRVTTFTKDGRPHYYVKTAEGKYKTLRVDQWDWKREEAPAPAAPDKGTPGSPVRDAPRTTRQPSGKKEKRAFVIPINGPIMHSLLVDAVAKSIARAKAAGIDVLVFHMNTPGGRVDVADRIVQEVGKVDWATTVAWIQGGEKQALSAGAYICLVTDKIYMAPGTIIGAATPYLKDSTGSAQVDEKMTSAFRARFRSLAQQRGHPPAVADAMVDSSVSVVQATLGGKPVLVTEDEAQRMARQHGSKGAFRRGKTVSRKGKLLTLTSQEALEYGLSEGHAADLNELAQKVGFDAGPTQSAAKIMATLEEEAKRRQELLQRRQAQFDSHMKRASESDPARQQYMVDPYSGNFTDGGKLWRNSSRECLAHLARAARVLGELERMSKDKRFDFPVREETFVAMKTRMKTLYDTIQQNKNRKRP